MPANAPHAQLNDLLHWAVENTASHRSSPTTRLPSTAIASISSTQIEHTSTEPGPTPQLNLASTPADHNDRSTIDSSRTKLDTGVLDAILGRTDALRMREAMEILDDRNRSLEERCRAAEEMEELVEDLDNANDMEILGFWPRLVKLLETGGGSQDEDQIKFYTCWICGTAVQNNPKSQVSFLKRDPLPIILEILTNNSSETTQAKALYCLSSTLRHAPIETRAMETFKNSNGWETLHNCLRGPSMILRRKTVFLVNTLLAEQSEKIDMIDSVLESLRITGFLNTLIDSLSPQNAIPTGPNGDLLSGDDDYIEAVIRTLVTMVSSNQTHQNLQQSSNLRLEEKRSIKQVLIEIGLTIDSNLPNWISKSEWDDFFKHLNSEITI